MAYRIPRRMSAALGWSSFTTWKRCCCAVLKAAIPMLAFCMQHPGCRNAVGATSALDHFLTFQWLCLTWASEVLLYCNTLFVIWFYDVFTFIVTNSFVCICVLYMLCLPWPSEVLLYCNTLFVIWFYDVFTLIVRNSFVCICVIFLYAIIFYAVCVVSSWMEYMFRLVSVQSTNQPFCFSLPNLGLEIAGYLHAVNKFKI